MALFSFDEKDCWGGEWRLIDGVLRLNINIYELDVVEHRWTSFPALKMEAIGEMLISEWYM